jgi:hypothetical protein
MHAICLRRAGLSIVPVNGVKLLIFIWLCDRKRLQLLIIFKLRRKVVHNLLWWKLWFILKSCLKSCDNNICHKVTVYCNAVSMYVLLPTTLTHCGIWQLAESWGV